MKSTRLSLNKKLLTLDLAPIFGADGEGEGAGGTGGAGTTETGGEGAAGAGGSGSTEKPEEGGDPQKKITALEEEKNRHFTARQAAEKERDDLKAWKEEQERKGKSDLENLQTDLKTVKAERDQLAETNQRLLVQVAFLGTNDVQWHNPERALALVDLSDVEIKDGKVDTKALKAAIDALAKSDSYLVKTTEAKEEKPGTPPGRSGQLPGNGAGRTGQQPDPDRAKVLAKFPSLRNR